MAWLTITNPLNWHWSTGKPGLPEYLKFGWATSLCLVTSPTGEYITQGKSQPCAGEECYCYQVTGDRHKTRLGSGWTVSVTSHLQPANIFHQHNKPQTAFLVLMKTSSHKKWSGVRILDTAQKLWGYFFQESKHYWGLEVSSVNTSVFLKSWLLSFHFCY